VDAGAGVPLGRVVAALLVVLAASPLLAGWSAALAAGVTGRWWWPRPVSRARWATVTGIAVLLTVAAGAGRPWPAWLLLAAVGAVLVAVDTETHRLPARLVYPLAGVLAAVLVAAAAETGESDRLLRAGGAAAAVGATWFLVVFLAPAAMGLGDVRLFAVTAGLLGWIGWPAVVAGQLAAFLLAGVSAVIIAAGRPQRRGRRMRVPMGPAILSAALLVCWLP